MLNWTGFACNLYHLDKRTWYLLFIFPTFVQPTFIFCRFSESGRRFNEKSLFKALVIYRKSRTTTGPEKALGVKSALQAKLSPSQTHDADLFKLWMDALLWTSTHDSHSSCDPLTSETLLISVSVAEKAGPWTDTQLKHGKSGPNCYNPHLWHVMCLLSLPSGCCLVCAFSPIEESAAHFWHHCLGEMNPGKAEVGSVGRTGLPQPVGAAHLIQFTQCIGSSIWQTAASAHGSLWANICYPFASISHFPHIQPKHTTKNCYTTAAFILKQPT